MARPRWWTLTSASDQGPRVAAPGRAGTWLNVAGVVAAVACAALVVNSVWPCPFSDDELRVLRSLSLHTRPPAPRPDPSNRHADDPRAALLGARLFHDPRLSGNGKISCATCHVPRYGFADGRAVAQGMGVGRRNTPSIVAAAHAQWLFWDGRRDSQWAQALVPLEGAVEHGITRTEVARVILRHHRAEFEAVFGAVTRAPDILGSSGAAGPFGSEVERLAWAALPAADRAAIDGVFANVGKALAAYQRRLTFRPARFDRYVAQLARGNRLLAALSLSREEVEGVRLFVGKGQCTLCHAGALLTNHDFFTLGLPSGGGAGDDGGRADAFRSVRDDPFNCLGPHSDAAPADCGELTFMSDDRLAFWRTFKTPSLRNVALTAPYMHDGRFQTLEQVVDHYARAPRPPFPAHSDILPRAFTAAERRAVAAFLGTLSAPIDDPVGAEFRR